MQHDFEKSAAAMVAGAQKAIAAAVAPLLKRIEELEARKPEQGPPGEKGDPGEKGEAGKDGQDGRGIADLLIDRDGNLIASMDEGSMKNLGPVVGKDGRDGADGKDGDPGRDGLGFEDMDACVLDDDRTIELSFRRGDEEKAFTFKWPTILDRGPFKIDRELPYEAGDGVTWGGQFYICNEQTNEKPDLSKDGKPWRLAVRKGRDGKDAKVG